MTPSREHILDRPEVTAAVLGAVAGYMCIVLGLGDLVNHGSLAIGISWGMGLGAVFGFFKRARLVLAVDLVLLAFYYILALTPIVDRLGARWIRNDQLPAKPADALVVLSASVEPNGLIDGTATERLLTGMELVRAGAAARLITTVVVLPSRATPVTSADDQRRLVHLAGLDSLWTPLDHVANTRHEAERAAALLPASNRTIVVVTSAMHTRRACATFEGVGFRVYCVAAGDREFDTVRPRIPRNRIPAFRFYLYERIGMWKYKLEGWVK